MFPDSMLKNHRRSMLPYDVPGCRVTRSIILRVWQAKHNRSLVEEVLA